MSINTVHTPPPIYILRTRAAVPHEWRTQWKFLRLDLGYLGGLPVYLTNKLRYVV